MKRTNKSNIVITIWIFFTILLINLPIYLYAVKDITPPELVEFDFDPKTVDVSTGDQIVTFTLRITDDLRGFYAGGFSFINFPSSQHVSVGVGDYNRISGDALDGIYQTSMVIPQLSANGVWEFWTGSIGDGLNPRSLSRQDLIASGFPATFTVTGEQDITPPELVEFDFDPKTVDVSSTTQWVTATLRITDDLSGSKQPYVRFISPSGQQASFAWGDVVSGPPQNRIYDASLTFPAFSEMGTWHIDYIRLSDAVGNEISYSESDLIALGFPTELEVEYVEDSDGDGIPDYEDACPNSDLSETVIIDSWDTGVGNVLLVDGCTISDLISECAEGADNHGEFVSSVSHTTNTLKKEGIISGKDKGKIQKCAAKADNP